MSVPRPATSRSVHRNGRPRRPAPAPTRRRKRDWWADLPDEELLTLRFRDLRLTIDGTWLEERVERLYDELAAKGLSFRPHCWLSSEWFSPDGVPGIAIPFYLAHPRLMKLEERHMLQVEGGSASTCIQILRHEAGHAIDTAYRLHHRKAWRDAFGSFADPYPDYYQPKPNSRKYVFHLGSWYAQAHPAEDFAETFAVWLTPRSRWRQQYTGWPALKKLETVDTLMRETEGRPQANRSRAHVEAITDLSLTLREHYRQRKLHYGDEWPDFYDNALRRIFSDDAMFAGRPTAASFLRTIRSDLRERVADWTSTHPYTIDQVLGDMIDRCKELKLRLKVSESRARSESMIMVTVQTMNYVLGGHHRVAL